MTNIVNNNFRYVDFSSENMLGTELLKMYNINKMCLNKLCNGLYEKICSSNFIVPKNMIDMESEYSIFNRGDIWLGSVFGNYLSTSLFLYLGTKPSGLESNNDYWEDLFANTFVLFNEKNFFESKLFNNFVLMDRVMKSRKKFP
jgi:hypothetical protein